LAESGGGGADPRTSIVVIAVAIVLAALLQLVVFEQLAEGRLLTLGVEVVFFVALIWAYSGGYARAAASYENWALRRHIRRHPEMVTRLEGLIADVDDVFGQGNDRFTWASQTVLNEWNRVDGSNRPAGTPSVFTDGERTQKEMAHRAALFWGTHSGDWPTIRDSARHLLATSARTDGEAYAWAASLIRSYIASSLLYIRDFTLNAQQAGMSKLAQLPLADWSKFAVRVNEVVRAARQIDRIGPESTGYDLQLRFEPVVENLAMAAPPNTLGTTVKVVVGPPTSGQPASPPKPS
jgi:hypothetical protein